MQMKNESNSQTWDHRSRCLSKDTEKSEKTHTLACNTVHSTSQDGRKPRNGTANAISSATIVRKVEANVEESSDSSVVVPHLNVDMVGRDPLVDIFHVLG